MSPPSHSSLGEILRHLDARAANLVHLRAGQPPVFWKDNARLADEGALAIQSEDAIRRLICIPLTDEQIAAYRRQSYASVELRIAGYGAFHLEAYVRQGLEEVVIANAAQLDAWALFRDHAELLAEARSAPEDADAYWNLGVAFLEEDEPQLAWHAFEAARARDPDDAAISFQIGKVLGHELCRVDEAVVAFERALARGDAEPEVYVELAVMHRSSQRLREAEAAVRRGLEAHPDHAMLLEARDVIASELAP